MEHIRVNDLEIVVLVEGIESVTSNKMQARFSFMPCVRDEDGNAEIDFEKFQQVVPLDEKSSDSLFLQSVL